jgi:hypothetical protein
MLLVRDARIIARATSGDAPRRPRLPAREATSAARATAPGDVARVDAGEGGERVSARMKAWREVVAPRADDVRIGPFLLLARTDGRVAIVDTRRRWDDATVSHHALGGDAEVEAQRLALLRPGAYTP